jgi:ubiquinone/menaquinone biosynthesis C-methylase UbiE
MMDLDIWELMFQTKYYCRNGLTMHHFETPPRLVLDLGCGSGLWIIEAAKQWKVTKRQYYSRSSLTNFT